MGESMVSPLVGKVVDLLFGVAIKEFSYMWNCKENVKTLQSEVENLKLMREKFQQQINNANFKGDNLVQGVEEWSKKAANEISKAEVFLQHEANAHKTCFRIRICANWGTLYHYGKMATKMAYSLSQHQVSGKSYESGVSLYNPPPGPLDSYENKDLDGGVGKTTLAKEVVPRVKHLFHDVAFITVSQSVDIEKIKKESEDARKRIKKKHKLLIILDDVWETLSWEELCMPLSRNLKILLTTRSEKVCQKMKVDSKIYVDSLPAKEAWILFKRVVGEKVETDTNLKQVAYDVAAQCGGLPLFIQAVGNALKDETINTWKATLSRLKKPVSSELDLDIAKAFTRLQLSYEYLKSEEAKSCFLLCAMFPSDYTISLEDLVYYMVGLYKFDDLDSMEDARDRVRNAVNLLTSSCLLLKVEDDEGFTKMHDVIHDVAMLIASKGKNKYLVKAGKRLTKWLPKDNNLKSYTGISLMNNSISELPDCEIHLSSLDIFLVNNNSELSIISDKFIEGMREVKVLDMRCCQFAQLPQSLKLLTKLRVLNLEENYLFHEISILGEMKDLEILILNRTGIKEIPKEIGELVNLRRLEVIRCRYMTRVTSGVILKLQSLEELYIDLSKMREGVNGCLAEVMKLSNIIYLDLTVKCFDLIPKGFNLENLKRFVIQIGDFYLEYELRGDFYQVNELRRLDRYLIISSEHVMIALNNIMPTLYKVEHIELYDCPHVSCLVDDGTLCDGDEGKTKEKCFKKLQHLELGSLSKLEVIWKCPDEYISLSNLVKLYIYSCDKLERIFTITVAQGLVNLKKLKIEGCDSLEEVIWGSEGRRDDASGNVIVFPSLAQILLLFLRKLKGFFNSVGNCSIRYPSLVDVEIRGCGSMDIWGPGIHETPNLKTLVGHSGMPIAVNGSFAINETVKKSLRLYNQPTR
uniref:probable disease resistance protein At4g27220 n=1 Tax=Erigeron canadensis TaxID=72917 RepID=UPI001CB998E4|nr:probable disease resistance protein At4g27220 [Erigeron canadensis]